MPSVIDPRDLPGTRDYALFEVVSTEHQIDTRDMMLFLTDVEIDDPEARRYQVDVPGRDGALDLTEALGGTYFDNREIRLTFECVNYTTARFHLLSSQLRNALDGRLVRLILSDDFGHFWRGRCQVATDRSGLDATEVVITMDAEPHKYSVAGSYEPWKWSPFSFVDGVITQPEDIVLNNETVSVTLPQDPARLKPTLWLNIGGSGTVQAKLASDPTWHILRKGKNVIPEIRQSDTSDVVLQLRGTGRVGVDYRVGSL